VDYVEATILASDVMKCLFSGKVFDACMVCGGKNECVGCDGIPNPSGNPAQFDLCGKCNGTNDCFGCDGIPYPPSLGVPRPVNDLCGVCGGKDECIGCDGKPYPPELGVPRPVKDRCDVCNGTNACVGCDDIPVFDSPPAVVDGCGICNGDNSTCSGCDKIPPGPGEEKKVFDRCGICGGNNTCVVVDVVPDDPNEISPGGIIGIVVGSIIGLLIGILAPLFYIGYLKATKSDWFIPSDLTGKGSTVRNNPLYDGEVGPRDNVMAGKRF